MCYKLIQTNWIFKSKVDIIISNLNMEASKFIENFFLFESKLVFEGSKLIWKTNFKWTYMEVIYAYK